MNLLNIIRWKNLLMIAIVQLLIKYALFPAFAMETTLNTIDFFVLILATVFIAAGGYVINDIYDIETDAINKPSKVIIGKSITENKANKLYFLFTITGVCLGFYLSHAVGRPPFFGLFVIISALLYVYASYLKQIAVAGNIVVSILVALSLLIVGIFELIPVITIENENVQTTMLEILTDFGIFAFLINFIREIVKDIQDVDGDHKAGMQTLPILFGKTRTSKITMVLTIITILIILYYITTFLYMHEVAVAYYLIAVVGPLIYITIKLYSAENNAHFKHISLMLKLVMVSGMLSMVLYRIIL
ncbi:geranylgeranylglycerol-phosphate geranylgeranyltransferase [Lacinutrix sp.]|uniref:geranylgeranylglycerol-phosphate geranylgeranyltransferase n=1 Tax=Lacinutrix sp. TaxID=1937692 RepID=UPI00262D6FDD|nr:geranylgeranylglycerol-phosphate geranylgeranyltransferase [Lacinutrix sp.]MDG1715378.1 geranylgeranylglycerol-phosphate geranylgeranyltransferase [Lacinutrix sp.]